MILSSNKDGKVKLAKEMLDKMGVRDRQLRNMSKAATIYSNDSSLQNIIAEEASRNVDVLIVSMAEIYADLLNEKDLKSILEFINSKAGQRYINANSKLESALTTAGSEWTRTVLQKSGERYQSEYLKRKAEEGIVAADYIPPLNIKLY